jgi:hypothetical protein
MRSSNLMGSCSILREASARHKRTVERGKDQAEKTSMNIPLPLTVYV